MNRPRSSAAPRAPSQGETHPAPSASSPPAPPVHSSPWAFWPRFLMFPLLAVVGSWMAARTAPLPNLWLEGGVILFLSYCWFCVAGSFHESVHQTLFQHPALNLWYGRVIGTLLGIPYTAYRESHRWHHAYLNTPRDFELWPYSDPRRSLWFRRIFVMCDVLFGVATAPVIYGRIAFQRPPVLGPDVLRTLRREYAAMILFWGAVIALATWATMAGRVNWSIVAPVAVLPLALATIWNTVRKFVEHVGLESTDPVGGTRTILGGNWISRGLAYFNFDIAVHGPHHRYPRARHFELPARFDDWRTRTGGAIAAPVYPSYLAAARDMLPCLWRCPAVGDQAARDLGRPTDEPANTSRPAPQGEPDWESTAAATE